MVYFLDQVLRDKKLMKTMGDLAKNHCLHIVDGNDVFSFDFEGKSLRINLRQTYDRLMELGGEKLLRKLLKEGKTCLTDDLGSAKQGLCAIRGTDKFYLQTNAGDTKMIYSILRGVAGWAETDKAFNAELISISEADLSEEGEEDVLSAFESIDLGPFEKVLEWSAPDSPSVEQDRTEEFELCECLMETESCFDTYIIKKDGWMAVAEVDLRGMPRIHRMYTPFAFTSITRKGNWAIGHLLVERFGKKGVYNWTDNTYPVPCRYDNVCLHNENSCSMYKVSILDQSHVVGFWGGWLKTDLPPCPKCGAAQTNGAVYCHKCGTHLKDGEKKEAPVAEVKKEEAKPAPAPQPAAKPEPPKAQKVRNPDVPTLGNVGAGGNIYRAGSASRVSNGQLRVTVQYDDDTNYDTDPEHFLYGSIEFKKKDGAGGSVVCGLSNIAAYALAEDGIFYAKYNQIYFMNIYGEKKVLGSQEKVISMTDKGNGILSVEYLVDYHQTGYRDYRCPMDMWEIWEDVYKVNTQRKEFRY